MTGSEIKTAILNADLKVWQVADAYGITDGNFSRKLRHDFNETETAKIMAIIDDLKAKK